MFNPKYSISPKLLGNIKRIAVLVAELSNRRFPQTVLLEIEKSSQALSAHTSTAIEGNQLGLTQVKNILKNKPDCINDTEQEILNYNNAVEYLKALDNYQKLELDLILKIQKLVCNKLISKNNQGKIRKDPVFIYNPQNGKTIYWPPDHCDVSKLLNELIIYVQKNYSTIDPLILGGIFHKRLVTIHPFIDGNGRTARLITKYLLANLGLDTYDLFSFENYYNKNVTKYFQKVGVFGNYYEIKNNIDFTDWLEYFTGGIIDELLRCKKELEKLIEMPGFKISKHHNKILKHIQEHGFINDLNYSKITDRAKATRSLDFKTLVKLRLITRVGKGRATYYILSTNGD